MFSQYCNSYWCSSSSFTVFFFKSLHKELIPPLPNNQKPQLKMHAGTKKA